MSNIKRLIRNSEQGWFRNTTTYFLTNKKLQAHFFSALPIINLRASTTWWVVNTYLVPRHSSILFNSRLEFRLTLLLVTETTSGMGGNTSFFEECFLGFKNQKIRLGTHELIRLQTTGISFSVYLEEDLEKGIFPP